MLYLGHKLVDATPMSRQAYNDYRGWQLPKDENGDDEGYLVEYVDNVSANRANTHDRKGYVSWSPKDAFDYSYREVTTLPFALALEAVKTGARASRKGWNGKDMFIFLVPGSTFKVSRAPLMGIFPEGTEVKYRGHIDLRTADGSISVWSPSNSDVLAEDWVLL